MYHFLELSLSFPVVIFSLGLMLSAIYWLLVCGGLLDVEYFDIGIHAVTAYDKATARASRGLLKRFGLTGMPVAVVFTSISLVGWLTSYFFQLFIIGRLTESSFYYPTGIVSGLVSLLFALKVTVLISHLLSPLLLKLKGASGQPVSGRVAIVRSATVTRGRGTALLEDGGAGLILQVRSLGTDEIKRNDRVVILQYIADEHVYHVISETEFMG